MVNLKGSKSTRSGVESSLVPCWQYDLWLFVLLLNDSLFFVSFLNQMQNGDRNSTILIGLLCVLNESIHVMFLEQCLEHTKSSGT